MRAKDKLTVLLREHQSLTVRDAARWAGLTISGTRNVLNSLVADGCATVHAVAPGATAARVYQSALVDADGLPPEVDAAPPAPSMSLAPSNAPPGRRRAPPASDPIRAAIFSLGSLLAAAECATNDEVRRELLTVIARVARDGSRS